MSAMVNLEIPWINVMSKMDLVTSNPDDPSSGARNGLRRRKDIARSEFHLSFLARRFYAIYVQSGGHIHVLASMRVSEPDFVDVISASFPLDVIIVIVSPLANC